MGKWVVLSIAVAVSLVAGAGRASAGIIVTVGAGGDLQAAINAAQPGDTILLEAGATFVGNFTLPDKGPSTEYITIRSAAADSLLPAPGYRISPAYAAHLPKIRSSNDLWALKTDGPAHHWRLLFLEFQANFRGKNDILGIGNASSQTSEALIPHHIIVDRVLIRGDRLDGQKRAIGLHGRFIRIMNSHISDCKSLKNDSDSQAIAGWNGPGPYFIENNYLEAAAENVLFGGADPVITNMMPADIVIRRNYLHKPIAWRDPILSTPQNVVATAGTGGTLADGAYSYQVIARRPIGPSLTIVRSSNSAVASAVVAAGGIGAVTLQWAAVPDAMEYRVHRTGGGTLEFWTTTGTTFIDTGVAGTAGLVPTTTGTRWKVKNHVELKVGRRVTIDGNLAENNWESQTHENGQRGYSFLFKSTNQSGKCTWCQVEDVEVIYNTVCHVTAAVNVSGNEAGTIGAVLPPPLKDLTVRHNLFYDSNESWGTSVNWMLIGNGPSQIVVDHNTAIHRSQGILFLYDFNADGTYETVPGLSITNNLLFRNTWGVDGEGADEGADVMDKYAGAMSNNVVAGGSSTLYPTDFTTTDVDLESQFINYVGDNYALKTTSLYKGAGTDGLDLGGDIAGIRAEAALALAGTPGALKIRKTTQPVAVKNQPYWAVLQAFGGTGYYTNWKIVKGKLPAGLTLDPLDGVITGAATVNYSTWAFVVEVSDGVTTTRKTLSIDVKRQ
jgi:hypothetical protein